MLRSAYLLIACAISFAGIHAGASDIGDLSGSVPNSNTPRELQEAWLRFHESDLCQEIDALFLFHKSGIEVWSRIDSDKSLQKYQELFEPLKDAYAVELYTTRPPAVKKQANEDDPPPSLWMNSELRSSLGVLFVKQGLLMYAEQILNWNKKIERFGADLPALTRVAHDPAMPPDLRSKALGICAAHVQNLEKFTGKLAAGLAQAFPSSEKNKRGFSQTEIFVNTGNHDPIERAAQIAAISRGVSRRVYFFIYPEHYTVGLDELRHPSLLESLETLREMASDFQKSLGSSARMKQKSVESRQ